MLFLIYIYKHMLAIAAVLATYQTVTYNSGDKNIYENKERCAVQVLYTLYETTYILKLMLWPLCYTYSS